MQLAGVDLVGLAGGSQTAPGWAPTIYGPLQNIIGNSDHHLSHPLSCSFLSSAASLGAIWKQCTSCRERPACRFEGTALSRQWAVQQQRQSTKVNGEPTCSLMQHCSRPELWLGAVADVGDSELPNPPTASRVHSPGLRLTRVACKRPAHSL